VALGEASGSGLYCSRVDQPSNVATIKPEKPVEVMQGEPQGNNR